MNVVFNTLLQKIESLVSSVDETDKILFNICKLLKESVFHYDWVGFYLLDKNKSNLILGPFYGPPTEHVIIPVGKGVCGQVAENGKLKLVQDVNCEENYISCSLNVQSEIVVPILVNEKFVAEIDIDSHSSSPFTKEDEAFLTEVCQRLSRLF
jgi:L-methionine (R)-S-oxide reductase